MNRLTLFLVGTITASTLAVDGGIRIVPQQTPWQGKPANAWDWLEKDLVISNETGVTWQVDGFRATWPNFLGEMKASEKWGSDIVGPVTRFDDGYGEDRWTIRLSGVTGSGENEGMLKTIKSGDQVKLPLMIKGTPDNNWEPTQPFQYLIKTGTFGNDYGFIDIKGVTLDTLYKVLENPDYYNPDHYVRDSLGQRGGPYSGGFIDTWVEQDSLNPVPVTQFQINFLPDDEYITMNGRTSKYRPDLMGEHTPAGPGPMYAMSLAMAQEYMHVDMQLIASIGSHESMAALEVYEPKNGDGPLTSIGVFYCDPNKPEGATGWNLSQKIGTMHYIARSYEAYAWLSYPKFFPYDQNSNYLKHFKTPGSPGAEGYCGGNNATIGNAALINTLYMWYGFNLFYNATSFDYRKLAPQMKDTEFAAKLFAASWNGGWGIGHEQLLYDFHSAGKDVLINDPDVMERVPNNAYVKKVYQTLPKLLSANKNSRLNTSSLQNTEVYDSPITKEQVAEFYFGMNVKEDGSSLGTSVELAESGKLGIQGVLHHFRLSDEQRKQIWSELNTAYDMMKGKAPSTSGSDHISLRYDWITLMRIAKIHLNLDMPVPVYSEFMAWVKEHSKVDNIEGVNTRDSEYPTIYIDESSVTFDADENFYIEVDAKDNDFFENTDGAKPIEWTIDEYWETWSPGTIVSTSEVDADNPALSKKGRYRIAIPKSIYRMKFGDNPGRGWLRVSDRNRNSVIQRFDIPGIKYPRFKDGAVFDINGDGRADSIRVSLIPVNSDAEGVYKIADYIGLEHAWPDTSLFFPYDASTMEVSNGTDWLAIKDPNLQKGAGFGAVKLEYPTFEGATWVDEMMRKIRGELVDSVGPALIDKAQFNSGDNNRDRDTLFMAVSEPLKDAFAAPYKYLEFSLTEDGVGESVEALSFELLNAEGDSIKVTLPKGTIETEKYLWVKLLNNGVTDVVDNFPADNSQRIPINISGTGSEFGSAAIYDTKGDGMGDKIEVILNLGTSAEAMKNSDVDSVFYTWNNSDSDVDTVLKTVLAPIDADRFSFTVNSSLFQYGHGEGVITLKLSNGETMNGVIADSTGPAITAAAIDIEDAARAFDTLTISVSEKLEESKIVENKSYLLFKSGNDEIPLESSKAEKIGDTEWKFFFPRGEVANKQAVKFIFNSGIEDPLTNKPLAFNQWVPLTITGGITPTFNEAFIIDQNGDGFGDSIAVRINLGTADNRLTMNDLEHIEYSWNDHNSLVTIETSALTDLTEAEFGIVNTSFTTGHGEGLVKLIFPGDPDKLRFSEPIVDSVGPALTGNAIRLFSESREFDTVVVSMTEELKNGFSDDSEYFVIINGSDERVVASNRVEQNGLELRIIFDYNTIKEGDHIAFAEGKGIEDKNGNVPHPDNIHIPITLVGGKMPSIVKAEMFDNNGDGTADSIVAELALGTHKQPYLASDVQVAKYTWPGKTSAKEGTLSNDGDKFVIIKGFEEPFTGGDGSLTLDFPENQSLPPFSLADKAGPVITKAELWENLGGDDSLRVTFSEEITGSLEGSVVIKVEGKSDKSVIKAEPLSLDGTVWLFTFSAGTLANGDWINIRSESNLRDMPGNAAHMNNIKVQIEELIRPITVDESRSYYLDTPEGDAVDGKMDRIEIQLNKAVDSDRISSFHAEFTWPNRDGQVETFAVSNDKISVDGADNSRIILDVSGKNLQQGMTYVDGNRFGELTLFQKDSDSPEDNETRLTPKDRMAAVLIGRAEYRGKKLTSEEKSFIDTLIVQFSEETEKIGTDAVNSSLFVLNNGKELNLIEEIGRQDHRVMYSVQVTSGESYIPSMSDEITIQSGGKVVDKSDNQVRNKTPYVPFGLVLLPAEYEVVVYPNPYVIDGKEENELLDKYGITGKGKLAIMVRPFGDRVGSNLKANITMYDAVGNVIVSGKEFEQMDNNALLISSEMDNKSGRSVGTGLYRAIITVSSEDANGTQTTSYNIMIGVKKKGK